MPALEPWLGRLFYAARRIADQTWPDRPPYDFWLDYNEEGLTEAKCTEFFSALREGLLPLLERAQHLPELDTDILNCRVAPIYQQRIAHFNMDALGVDRGRCRLSLSDHAFTGGLFQVRRAHLHAVYSRELHHQPLRRHARVRPCPVRAEYG